MMESEELIQQALNQAGCAATAERLKDFDTDGSPITLEEMKRARNERKLGKQVRADLETALGCYENHRLKVDYHRYREACLPIGSGVTEAACKRLVKERMSGSGMKWKSAGASEVLRLRSLMLTEGRWEQFWSKVSRFGV